MVGQWPGHFLNSLKQSKTVNKFCVLMIVVLIVIVIVAIAVVIVIAVFVTVIGFDIILMLDMSC